MSHHDPAIVSIMEFLSGIGLQCTYTPSATGFAPGIQIVDGELRVGDQASISWLLHEAGHLATLPGDVRHLASGNIAPAQVAALNAVEDCDPDEPRAIAAMQCSDMEATAWAWAAGVHLGLPSDEVIRDEDYGQSGSDIRLMLSQRAYAGINGLARAGFCASRPGAYAAARNLPVYPQLARWLQVSFEPIAPVRTSMMKP